MSNTAFVPVLTIPAGTMEIDFYKKAFDAVELRRWSNDDGSIHVAELTIDGAMFHLHEENLDRGSFSPGIHHGITAVMGLMVMDVDALYHKAVEAGATVLLKPQDYDYGYRQADIADIFGHRWTIEAKI
jgi:PhnB protein